MIKVYAVRHLDRIDKVFLDKLEAHKWAENKYGSETDGIIVNNVTVKPYELKEID